ncbi:MAG: hypothetical protein JXA42_18030 [Anaerolineales bacterium]|nr:hypothetical protein [Anaerolineales bacterium]
MRIALCVKQVLDATGPFNITEVIESLNNSGLVPITNPADLAALALVRKAFPAGDAQVTTLTVGPGSADRTLRACIAFGADEAIRIWDSTLERAEPGGDTVARVLSAAISMIGFDLVVCGSRGLNGGSGYVGPALAEYLDFAQVCSVSHVELSSGGNALTVHRKLDHGDRQVVTCKLPAVITVDDGAAEVPYASFPAMVAAERMDIRVLDLASIGSRSSDVKQGGNSRFLHYLPPRPRTKKTLAPDKSLNPLQLMQQAMGVGGAKQTSNVVEGEPKKAAAEIIRFLVTNDFLSK